MPKRNLTIKELNEFRWNDVPLKMGPSSWAECRNLLDHTAWIVEQLRTCPFGAARVMLQNSTNVQRLFRPKMKQIGENKWEKPQINVNTDFHAAALAYYLFFDSDKLLARGEPGTICSQCREQDDVGPGDTCFSGNDKIIEGTCFNCIYKGLGKSCSLRLDLKQGKFLGFTTEMLKDADIEQLAEWYAMCDEGVRARFEAEQKEEEDRAREEMWRNR
ncbi:hypothetical protein LQW54_009673 [Pestalotiopsis sp. IQ-011]